MHFRTDGLVPTSGIRASEVLQPVAGLHQLPYKILDSVFLKNREEKDAYEAASHRVKSLIRVSQSVVLHLVIVTT